ncbi:MAG TPA: hybrid sensor histidine kinase/response regulator [Burkholderiaceae bacterium]|nr:hybrid sensor histidine kinase/response regulator [Burkholderiaceae bacterium]
MIGGPLTRIGLAGESRERRQERILAGVIASVYRQVPQSVLGSIVGGVALVAVFWHTHDPNMLIAWFIAMLLEALIRLRVARAYRAAAATPTQIGRWSRSWVAMSAVAGGLWGAAGVLFFAPQSPLLQLVLVAVILGVTFGSLTLYASHRPALLAFLPPALLPLIARMIAQQDPAYYTAAIVMFAVFSFTLFFGRNFGEAVSESVKNNYENEVLVAQLLQEKGAAEDARRAAENATRSKTQFFAAASHDLRQPLQAIGIYCSLLRKRAQGPMEPLVNNLSSAVESLSKLVEELLEISRLDSGAIQPRTQHVNADDLFSVLEREFTPQAASKHLSLRLRRGGFILESDGMLLQRVLRNLVANAIRYTTEGGILLAARRRGTVASLEIWDTGPGIRQQELDRIFEEFYRGESSKGAAGGGFGLGLSIVRRICGVLGHPLVVTTRLGSGTVFKVEVPISTSPRRANEEPAPTREPAMMAFDGVHIVVLEDNEEILNSLARLLRSWGADILSATAYTTGLVKKLAARNRVDLVIADQNLDNEISGCEAALRIRAAIGRPIPIIMLSAVNGVEVLADFQRQLKGFLARQPTLARAIARSRVEEPIVLQKPTNAAMLNAAVARALTVDAAAGAGHRKPRGPVGDATPEGTEDRV